MGGEPPRRARSDRVVDRRDVLRAVVWLSTDARRVPLALEFETSLGSFRAELDTYERR
jgi:hypothetical protein